MRLACTLSKDNCHVTWFKDNEEITLNEDENNRYIGSQDGRVYRLEIKQTKMSDAGNYALKVEDKEMNCQVIVTGLLYWNES